MLKYASKFFFEKILPSVVATVAGAYIVNHYVVSKPADTPAAAVASTADGKTADSAKLSAAASDGAAHVANIPASGVRAKGISEKAIEKTPIEKVIEKPAEKSADAKRRQPPAPREKAARSTAEEAAPAPDRRDASDLARTVIERLRESDEAKAGKPAEAAHAHEAPHAVMQEAAAVPAAPSSPPPAASPLPPPIMVSVPRAETLNAGPPASETDSGRSPPPIPPADIPAASRPLDLQANLQANAEPALRAHTSVADDMLSAAKSVFKAVLPR